MKHRLKFLDPIEKFSAQSRYVLIQNRYLNTDIRRP